MSNVMSKYARVSELQQQLAGVDLTAFGPDQPSQNAVLLGEMQSADLWAEDFVNRSFVPAFERYDTISGTGTSYLVPRRSPVLRVLQIYIKYDPLAMAQTLDPTFLRVDRGSGLISIKPTFAPIGGAVSGFGWNFRFLFPVGLNNIELHYWTGYGMQGSNYIYTIDKEEPQPEIMAVSTVADPVVFTTPVSFGAASPGPLSATPNRMFKDWIDDTANWTVVDRNTLTVPRSQYNSASSYVLGYVPAPVEEAVVLHSLAHVLNRLGMATLSPTSAGGATARKAMGYSENYGPRQFDKQIQMYDEHAREMLNPFRCINLV